MCQPGRPWAPRRFPRRLAGLGRFPQHEIERIAFGLVDLDARAGAQVREALAREPAVRLELRHRVIHIAIVGRVGVSLVDECLHHGNDLRHVLRRTRLAVGTRDSERLAIFLVGPDEALGQRRHRLAVFLRAVDDLVVDVGDVAHEVHVVTGSDQVATHEIEHDQHACVTEMAIVINGDAADVHADLAGHPRLEYFLATGQRIVDLQHDDFIFLNQ